MNYTVLWDPRTESDLRKIGRQGSERIRKAVTKRLACNPKLGKQLKGDFTIPLWSFRIGVYRVLYTFNEEKLIILIARVGHRKDVYDNLPET